MPFLKVKQLLLMQSRSLPESLRSPWSHRLFVYVIKLCKHRILLTFQFVSTCCYFQVRLNSFSWYNPGVYHKDIGYHGHMVDFFVSSNSLMLEYFCNFNLLLHSVISKSGWILFPSLIQEFTRKI